MIGHPRKRRHRSRPRRRSPFFGVPPLTTLQNTGFWQSRHAPRPRSPQPDARASRRSTFVRSRCPPPWPLRTSAPPARRRASSRAPARRPASPPCSARRAPTPSASLATRWSPPRASSAPSTRWRSGRPSARTPPPLSAARSSRRRSSGYVPAPTRARSPAATPRHLAKSSQHVEASAYPHVWRACFRSPALPSLTADVPPVPPVSPIVQKAAAVMPAAAANAADDQGVASSRMSYSRFLVRLRPSTTVSDDTLAVCAQARRDPKTRRRALGFVPKNRGLFSRVFSLLVREEARHRKPKRASDRSFPSFASL